MSERIEALPWDSEFFEMSIGSVDLAGVGDDDLTAIVAEARDRAFDCVYGRHDASDAGVALRSQHHGFDFIDAFQLMHRPAGPLEHRESRSVVREATDDDLADLEQYYELLAPWSRFGSDPRFGTAAAVRMFRAWVRRAHEEPHRLVTISADDEGINGVGTHVKDGITRIDLLGVIRPGTNDARLHLELLLDWCDGAETEGGPCAARNLAPLRFLEHAGYKLRSVAYTHHWWREDPTPR